MTGYALAIIGVALIFGLDPLLGSSEALAPFDHVQRRIPGGAVLGIALLLLKQRPFRPTLPFAAWAIGWVTVGALISRLIGLALVQGTPPMQWALAVLEAVVILVAWLYLRRRPDTADEISER